MSAYFIFTREKTIDPAELEQYFREVQATFAGHHHTVLAAYGKHEAFEGDDTEGVVIAEFPSMEAAKAWYNGDAYKKVREHRFKGAAYRAILVQGVPASSDMQKC
jgi:uncharacterized protein (DUF1330 family)